MSEVEVKEIVDKITQEEYPYALAIAKAYEKLDKENKKLKEQYSRILKENFNLKQHPILTELEKWLEKKIYEKVEPPFKNWEDERIDYYLNRREGFKECLDKLQELKRDNNEKV